MCRNYSCLLPKLELGQAANMPKMIKKDNMIPIFNSPFFLEHFGAEGLPQLQGQGPERRKKNRRC